MLSNAAVMTRGRKQPRPPQGHALRDIVARFGGRTLGDPGTRVNQVATLENASPGTIAFLANERYLQHLGSTGAAAVILNEAASGATPLPRIVCENPYAYFARVSALLNPPPPAKAGIHRTAVVDRSAALAPGVSVGPHAVTLSVRSEDSDDRDRLCRIDYGDDGRLIITREHHAVDPSEAAARSLRAIREGLTKSIGGVDIKVRADSICVHSDTPNAVDIATAVRAAVKPWLEAA